ncbi:MAG: hypothetical protein O3C39_12320 [Planctomycetota bacterium]|nr:hypothetical protein [Planctomycetota bacterium]
MYRTITASARVAICLIPCFLAAGCAHHRANQYAYAPPLAPPVYPQPQAAAQPVAYPSPPVVQPGVAAPPMVSGVPPAAAAPVMPTAGVVPAMPDGSCPPCNTGCEGGAVPVVYEETMQTTPCQ